MARSEWWGVGLAVRRSLIFIPRSQALDNLCRPFLYLDFISTEKRFTCNNDMTSLNLMTCLTTIAKEDGEDCTLRDLGAHQIVAARLSGRLASLLLKSFHQEDRVGTELRPLGVSSTLLLVTLLPSPSGVL